MPGIRHHGQARARPGGSQVEGGARRTDHVVATLHDLRRDVRDGVHPTEQAFGRQEQPVGEIMRLDPRQAQRRAVLREGSHRVRARQQGAARSLIDRPGARRLHVDGRVGIGQPAQIGAQQIAALRLGDVAGEGRVHFGEDRGQPMHEPFHLRLAAQEHATQHRAAHPARMRLGIGQRQGGAPRTAEQHPGIDVQVPAQRFDVVHQIRRRVAGQAAERAGSAGAALVEDDHAPERRIEEAAMHDASPGAGAAMQEQHRPAARIAHLLPVHDMPGRERQIAGLERANFRKQVATGHDPDCIAGPRMAEQARAW